MVVFINRTNRRGQFDMCVWDDCTIGIGTKTKRDPDVNVVVVLFVVCC